MEDGDFCNGTLICENNACEVDPLTVVTCDPSGDLPCWKNTCDPATGDCSMEALEDDIPCDDNDPCTEADRCAGGVCDGNLKDCDDGDACTNDACNPSNGQCQYAPVNCDDGDDCTIDSCDPVDGCQHDPDPNC
jgi:hypothetical protein